MNITEINIEFVKPCNGLIGFASLVVDANLYLSSIAIHKKLNAEGYRLTYPNKGNFTLFDSRRTLFHPINRQTSDAIEQAIFSKLKDVMSKNVCQRNMMQE